MTTKEYMKNKCIDNCIYQNNDCDKCTEVTPMKNSKENCPDCKNLPEGEVIRGHDHRQYGFTR